LQIDAQNEQIELLNIVIPVPQSVTQLLPFKKLVLMQEVQESLLVAHVRHGD
jgi:hypothetical protein